ncbi:hypothetical protein H4Q26_008585 [Puccinia striiformis f. sp. tritici PST-130]|nr:hypothetical protein H4Q26_008585 [Puccinia striiformis f. sp. tritici PST-130]
MEPGSDLPQIQGPQAAQLEGKDKQSRSSTSNQPIILSEQAHNPLGYVEQELALTNEDRKLIEDIAWERVVAKKVDEITKNWQHFELMALAKSKKDARKIMGVSDNRELTDFELLALSTVISEARTILRALENMKLL